MLILKRKVGQAICLTGGVRITVIEVGGKDIKLAFEAPDSIRIAREELLAREARGRRCWPLSAEFPVGGPRAA